MTLVMLRTFFGWGAILNLVWLTVIFIVFVCGKNWLYHLHDRWFNLPHERIDTILYALMGWYKLATFLLFVIPYIVLRVFL